MDPHQMLLFVVLGVLSLILLGNFIDTAFYNISTAKTGNVTGVNATILSLVGTVFLVGIFLVYIGMVS